MLVIMINIVFFSFLFNIMDGILEAFKQGIAPAIVVAIYLIITKIIDSKKEVAQAKISKELVNSITTISNFLNSITNNIITKDKERCRIVIKLSFENFEKEIFLFVRETIIANNIDKRKDYIIQSVENIVNAQYYEMYNYLSNFELDDKKVSGYCKEVWKDNIKSSIITIIFDENLDKTTKITETQTKLNTMICNYSTYIYNKTFNN